MIKAFVIQLLLLLVTMTGLQAAPEKVTVWFLKEKMVSFNPQWNQLKKVAESDYSQNCIPMGDGCFHPQIGFIKENPMDVKEEKFKDAPGKVESSGREIVKTFNSGETDKIDCDKNFYFDIYCGKEKSKAKSAGIEVWIDTSSSFRLIDGGEKESCERERMVRKIWKGCLEESVRFQIYDTSIKELGDAKTACQAYGLNDENRLLQWIESSNAKHLYIITDISEFTSALSDYLESLGATMEGIDVKAYQASMLPDLADKVIEVCPKP